MTLRHRVDGSGPPGRVGVIGAHGFVGSAVVRRLAVHGADVVAVPSADVDLLASGAADRLASRLAGCDSVVVVSAIAPARTVEDVIANLRMVTPVVESVRSCGIGHVVYISSDAVYAEHEQVVSEATPTAPTSLHGVMHVAREVALRQAVGPDLCILRPSLLYGVDDPHNGYGPNRFLRQAEAGEGIGLFGEGEEQRDHVAVDDLAAVVQACTERRSVGDLNVATGRSVSFREAADLAVAIAGTSSDVQGSARQNPVVHRHFDIARRLAAFPAVSFGQLEEGLAEVHRERGARGA